MEPGKEDVDPKSRETLRSPARHFTKKTIMAMVEKPLRLAAGNLRLCIQASILSIRYDDLAHTPLKNLECTRRRGGLGVVALRSKATQGKNKARLVIAWLDCVLKLLLEARGPGWKEEDRTGKMPSYDWQGWTLAPSQIGEDVVLVKAALSKLVNSGKGVGLTLSPEVAWCQGQHDDAYAAAGDCAKGCLFRGDWGSRTIPCRIPF